MAGADSDSRHSALLLRAAAIRYLEQFGFSVVPVRSDKSAMLEEWKRFQEQHPTRDEVAGWFSQPDVAGLAIVTGTISQVAVLDIDDEETFSREVGKRLPQTPTAHSYRGRHFYFSCPERLSSLKRSRGTRQS